MIPRVEHRFGAFWARPDADTALGPHVTVGSARIALLAHFFRAQMVDIGPMTLKWRITESKK